MGPVLAKMVTDRSGDLSHMLHTMSYTETDRSGDLSHILSHMDLSHMVAQ